MPSKVIDIGVGQTPYFIRFQTHCDADEYVGVDSKEEKLEASRNLLATPSPFRQPARKELIIADAANLPFESESFTLAIMSNMLSAPTHRDGDMESPQHIARGFGAEDSFYVGRKKAVLEALRLLKSGGGLLIYTDLIIYGQHSYEAILKELKRDPGVSFAVLKQEQDRIDKLNLKKVQSGDYCYCFLAELLPRSEVYLVTKL